MVSKIIVKIKENIHSLPVGSLVRVTSDMPINMHELFDFREATDIEKELYYNGVTTVPKTTKL